MLLQSKYMQHTEAVLKNPILFGDYRTAKSVSHFTLCCVDLAVIIVIFSVSACITTQHPAD